MPASELTTGLGRIGERKSPAMLVIAAGMLVGVLVLRLSFTAPGLGITLLYDLPVALVAAVYGTRAGLAAAVVAFGLYVLGENAAAIHVGGVAVHPKFAGYAARGVVFLLVGGLVGLYSDHSRNVERRFRELLESAPDATVIVDRSGMVIFANLQSRRLFGHSKEDLIGRRVETLIPERFRDRHLGDRETYAAHPATRVMGPGLELYALHADGHEIPVEISLSPLDTQRGRLVSAAIRDITERRRDEAALREARAELELRNRELERSNAELEQFAYIASHDLQEPLRVISGFVQLLERRYEGQLDEDADRFIASTVSGVDRMQQLIDALLSYSHIGNVEAVRKPVDTGALVAEIESSIEEQLEQAHGHIDFNGLPTVEADPVLMEQLFRNLISNALKFSEAEEPQVDIDASRDADVWTFSVKDNGPGIEARHREKVFVMFNRLHSRAVAGTGIGLAICKRIAERHGGRIWVESEPGSGSTFKFTLPAANGRAGERVD
jgi:PAS domain S-box-containing protein